MIMSYFSTFFIFGQKKLQCDLRPYVGLTHGNCNDLQNYSIGFDLIPYLFEILYIK